MVANAVQYFKKQKVSITNVCGLLKVKGKESHQNLHIISGYSNEKIC
jgi:predicted GNAT family acetyltransferase